MATAAYLSGRKKYTRPQAMLWADNSGTLTNQSLLKADGTGFAATLSGTRLVTLTGSDTTTKIIVGQVLTKLSGTGAFNAGGVTVVSVLDSKTFTVSADHATTGSLVFDVIVQAYIPAGEEYGSNVATNNVSVTAVAGNGTTVTYTCNNSFLAGDYVTVTGISPAGYSGTFLVSAATATNFTVTSTTTGTATLSSATALALSNFLILSDHNRGDITMSPKRIEKRERMINGRMRSYHVADKLTISTSWQNLPSRSSQFDSNINNATGLLGTGAGIQYTVDGGAGGAEILEWYENHKGSFWVYLAYDKFTNFGTNSHLHLGQYNELVQVYIADFTYTITKRGGNNYDFWNINVTLEEV